MIPKPDEWEKRYRDLVIGIDKLLNRQPEPEPPDEEPKWRLAAVQDTGRIVHWSRNRTETAKLLGVFPTGSLRYIIEVPNQTTYNATRWNEAWISEDNLPMTVEEARNRRVCRICGKAEGAPFAYHFGTFAHFKCLSGESKCEPR